MSIPVITTITFYLSSLVDYTAHRFINHGNGLFWTHKYHHAPTLVSSYMPGIIARPFSIITSIIVTLGTMYIFLVLCILFGITSTVPLYGIFFLQTITLISSHSSFLRKQEIYNRFLERLYIVSPREHYLHHSKELFCNYGNLSYLGDVLFKTYVPYNKNKHAHLQAGTTDNEDYIAVITFGKITLKKYLRKKHIRHI